MEYYIKETQKLSYMSTEEINMPRFEKGGFRDDQPRESHKAVCAECGEECDVPFKPTEGKPVYCRECYRKRRKF
jgi:CxxC-x17-CxxC domain-containing protein